MIGEPVESPADRRASLASDLPAYGVIWMLVAALHGSDETHIHSTAFTAIYLIALWTPLAIVGFIALGRKFFSFRRPERWPEESPVPARVKALVGPMAGLLFLLAVWSIFAGHLFGRHDPRYTVPQDGLWFTIGWFWFLQAYIAERKPLPPPLKHEPIWADLKPISSDHWGQPAQH